MDEARDPGKRLHNDVGRWVERDPGSVPHAETEQALQLTRERVRELLREARCRGLLPLS